MLGISYLHLAARDGGLFFGKIMFVPHTDYAADENLRNLNQQDEKLAGASLGGENISLWEAAMEAKRLIDGAGFDSETAKACGEAFEQAWAVIVLRKYISKLRVRLADVILRKRLGIRCQRPRPSRYERGAAESRALAVRLAAFGTLCCFFRKPIVL
jgi:hypothetical protein